VPGLLDGKAVIVTGSTRGLGRAFAEGLARAGARVVLNGTDPARTAEAEAELRAQGLKVVGLAGGVQDSAVADGLVRRCVEEFGQVDLVVNNAGITRDRTLVKMTDDDFDEVLAVHLRGAWALSRAAARAMREAGTGGGIVNVVSGSALFGLVGQSNYAAAKGGMLALTRALSLELGRHGIRVNALYPVALTDMTQPVVDQIVASGGDADAVPFGSADSVAPIVTWLASDQAADVTGQVLHFDGRDLTVWSHPRGSATARRDAWSIDDVAGFLTSDPSPLEPLHPDRWGAGTRSALAGSGGTQTAFVEAFSALDVDVLVGLCATDCVVEGPAGAASGVDHARDVLTALFAGVEGAAIVGREPLVAELEVDAGREDVLIRTVIDEHGRISAIRVAHRGGRRL
jgi:3-oxoacyl-[acyl-carrier protein] reductase